MKKYLTILTFLISTIIFAQLGDKNFIDQNYIEVTGKAELEIVPDEIYLKIFINEKDNKKKLSVSEIEKLMISKLSAIGIDIEKELTVKDFSSNFKYYWLGKSDIILSKEYQVLVHDAETAGKVFMELEKIGISNITIDKLDHSKLREYRKEVKVNAIKSAKEKASSLAVAIDQEIGRALFIQESETNRNYVSNVLSGKVAGIRIRGASSVINSNIESNPLNIEFEKIKIEYSILCRFELK